MVIFSRDNFILMPYCFLLLLFPSFPSVMECGVDLGVLFVCFDFWGGVGFFFPSHLD